MLKGMRPAGQARTLRSIAEDKNGSSVFVEALPPPSEAWSTQYKDDAVDAAGGSKAAGMTPADPKPFKLKGGA